MRQLGECARAQPMPASARHARLTVDRFSVLHAKVQLLSNDYLRNEGLSQASDVVAAWATTVSTGHEATVHALTACRE